MARDILILPASRLDRGASAAIQAGVVVWW